MFWILNVQNTDSRDSTLNSLQIFNGLLIADNDMLYMLCQKIVDDRRKLRWAVLLGLILI